MQRIYETERLYLRVLDRSQAALVLDYYTRNRVFLAPWEPIREPAFYTLPYQREWLKKELRDFEERNSLRLYLQKKQDPTRVIGMVCFNNIVRGAFDSCFLGYKSDSGEERQGYLTEALKKGIAIMFEEYGLHRIEANIMPRNTRSLRLVEKLGFENEGLARRYLKINGVWEDHIHMVLLRDEVK